ncbi:MAG: 3-dehydroquinate synthase [Candidatus Omnitrophota bacterium]
MKKIKVNLKEKSYDILIGNKLTPKFGLYIRKTLTANFAIIITTLKISKLYFLVIKKALIKAGISSNRVIIPDSEKAKSIFYLNLILKNIAQSAKGKAPFVVALGGGVVGDVAGFAASIYKRGIPYIQIPTTLLAQIDSSIGGKTAIDLNYGKNLVGSFYQPSLVLTDISFLNSLPKREICSGLAEMIKYALIKDAGLFSYLESNYKDILSLKPTALEKSIYRCAKIKAEIVSQDELERKGIRTILNFGHTIGHAIETVSSYRYNHGESIALGMIAASKIAKSLNLISLKTFERILNLIRLCGLPTNVRKMEYKKIRKVIGYDKKFIGMRNRFVLPIKIGKVIIKEAIEEKYIIAAVSEITKR